MEVAKVETPNIEIDGKLISSNVEYEFVQRKLSFFIEFYFYLYYKTNYCSAVKWKHLRSERQYDVYYCIMFNNTVWTSMNGMTSVWRSTILCEHQWILVNISTMWTSVSSSEHQCYVTWNTALTTFCEIK